MALSRIPDIREHAAAMAVEADEMAMQSRLNGAGALRTNPDTQDANLPETAGTPPGIARRIGQHIMSALGIDRKKA